MAKSLTLKEFLEKYKDIIEDKNIHQLLVNSCYELDIESTIKLFKLLTKLEEQGLYTPTKYVLIHDATFIKKSNRFNDLFSTINIESDGVMFFDSKEEAEKERDRLNKEYRTLENKVKVLGV